MDRVQSAISSVASNEPEISRIEANEKVYHEEEISAGEDGCFEEDPAEKTEEENRANEDETYEADTAEETEKQDQQFISMEDVIRESSEENRMSRKDVVRYRPLLLAFAHHDWEKVEQFIFQNPYALTAIIDEGSQTFFHIIAMSDQDGAFWLLNRYLTGVPRQFLEIKDNLGSTALTVAAAYGNTRAARLLVEFNRNLLNIEDQDNWLPLHHAAGRGHKETVDYFLSVACTPVEDPNGYSNPFAGFSGLLLVKTLIESNFYGTAFDILKRRHQQLDIDIAFRKEILETLASKPKGFASGSRLGCWKRLLYHHIPVQKEDFDDSPRTQNNGLPPHADQEKAIYGSQSSSTIICSPFIFLHKLSSTFGAWNRKLCIMLWNVLFLAPSIRGIRDTKLMHLKTVEIVRMLCDFAWSFQEASQALKLPILTAAKFGIPEIVKEIFLAYSNSLFFVDNHGNNTLMLAAIHRQENIFRLVTQTVSSKQFDGKYIKNKDANILHLAAKLAPAIEAPGAALQMQRELQWFKAVENYVRPTICEKRNKEGKTPRELFSKEHEILIEKGEKWMRDNASSCALVASLIITVVFAAAFTLPGGNNSEGTPIPGGNKTEGTPLPGGNETEGTPIFLHKLPFKIFVISDVLALFSATTSLLMFLGILTSRYSEEDFLVSLPRKLIIGLITLFTSIASMMVAFGATIYIVLSEAWKWVIIPIAIIGCTPVILFAVLQFRLLVQVYSSTFAPTIFRPLKNV